MKKILCAIIRFYQRYISPLKPPYCKCRYIPCCSQYGLEAIEKYGALKGSIMAVKRVARCNPFGGYGYDPVPEKQPSERPDADSPHC